MLTHPTLEKLQAMRLTGMAKAFEEQLQTADIETLCAEEHISAHGDHPFRFVVTARFGRT